MCQARQPFVATASDVPVSEDPCPGEVTASVRAVPLCAEVSPRQGHLMLFRAT
jgi:hypothetical protein